ncbi:hypothetical protein [Elongatibacter sediminis]|uniref:Integral membrane protein n=1 Tax=Elongatibacter sediminis TaxID=3119006 RepID=A0AAW9R997_9GAMM
MMRNLIRELERRNVLKVAGAYLVAAWLIAQVADLIMESFVAPDWTMRALLIALAIGFPIALTISWKFEVTAKGVIPESEVDRTVRITDQSGRRVDIVLIVIVAVVIVFMGLERFVFSKRYEAQRQPASIEASTAVESSTNADSGQPESTSVPTSEPAIAVLPFTVLSTGPDDDYFATGLSEEIINALGQLPGLRVTARSSSFAFRDAEPTIRDIAARLDATHVVGGSIARAGDRLRVTAQLLRAADDAQLWSESYDARSEDTLEVQTDIAGKVGTALGILIDDGLRQRMRHVGTRDIEAFIAYQKGMEYFERAHQEPNQISLLRQANVHFEDAYRREPGLAAASAYHTDLFNHVLLSQAAGELNGEITDRDVEEAPRHLAEDYDRIIEHARSTVLRRNAEFDRALMMGDWRRIGALSDQAAASSGCEPALWLHLAGPLFKRTGPVLQTFRRVAVCDPLRVRPQVHRVGGHLWSGDADRALAAARAGLERSEHPSISRNFALSLAFLGRHDEAAQWAAGRIRDENELLQVQSMLAAIRGDRARSAELESRYLGRHGPDDRSSLVLAALRGERAEANRLARLIDDRPFGHMVLLQAVYACLCGAPFDIAQTPVFAGLLESSGEAWPPAAPYALPLRKAP